MRPLAARCHAGLARSCRRIAQPVESEAGLAPHVVAEVHRVLRHLKEEGFSMVLVEQNTRLAFGLADDVVVLNGGRVAHAGGPDEIKDDEAFLAQHLGVH